MTKLQKDLKKFITNPKDDCGIIFETFKNREECLTFEISNDEEYFYICSDGEEQSIRAYYFLKGMKEESSIVCDILRIEKKYADIQIKSLDNLKLRITLEKKGMVSLCLL